MTTAHDPYPGVIHAGEEKVRSPAYRFDNQHRKPPGSLVVQQTLAGSAYLRMSGTTRIVGQGEAMLFAYGEPSQYGYPESESDLYHLRYVAFHPHPGLQPLTHRIREEFGDVLKMQLEGEASHFLRDFIAAFSGAGKHDSLGLGELAYRLLFAIYREQIGETALHDPVSYLKTLLDARSREHRNISQWMEDLPMSREHLTRRFRQRFGVSPAAYLRQRRLQQAERLLESRSNLNAEDLARSCGFSSALTLRRAYRQAFGRRLPG